MHKVITVQLSIELSVQGDLNADELSPVQCLFSVSRRKVTLTKK